MPRKVSTEKAIKLLRQGGIQVTKEEAEVILDFLYLIAKTYRKQIEMENQDELEPGDESNSKPPVFV
ncbi:MAG TPA: hypothetical protein VHN59_06880 [Chitinophagaceae bacterium]|nr:hypothetical protein [Chitinophagaceae bacterium]